jgi:hypothetical protein
MLAVKPAGEGTICKVASGNLVSVYRCSVNRVKSWVKQG